MNPKDSNNKNWIALKTETHQRLVLVIKLQGKPQHPRPHQRKERKAHEEDAIRCISDCVPQLLEVRTGNRRRKTAQAVSRVMNLGV